METTGTKIALHPPLKVTWKDGQPEITIPLNVKNVRVEAVLEDSPPQTESTSLDLTDCTISFSVRTLSGTRFVIEKKPCVIADPKANCVTYTFSSAEIKMFVDGRTYLGSFLVNFPDGQARRFGDLRLSCLWPTTPEPKPITQDPALEHLDNEPLAAEQAQEDRSPLSRAVAFIRAKIGR